MINLDYAKIKATAQVCAVLGDVDCLQIVEALKIQPLNETDLKNALGLCQNSLTPALEKLYQSGLVTPPGQEEVMIALSPFGVYGAKTLLDDLLGGSCGGHCGANCRQK